MKAKKINILFIIDYLHDSGGTETHLAHLATRLNRKQFNCSIVTFSLGEGALSQGIREAGVNLTEIPVARYYTSHAWRQGWRLSRLIKERQIDIVQTFHIKSDCYGALVAKLSGVAAIVSSKRDIGDLKNPWHFFLNRLARPIVNRYIVVAGAVGEVVKKKERVAPKKMVTIYNGVDLAHFSPPSPAERLEARATLGFQTDDFVVGTVAWLRPEKNYPFFFQALASLKKKIPELKVVVVGGGDFAEQFKDEFAWQGGVPWITFAGHVQDVRPFLRPLDVACLVPGQNEGFSNAILEKMAMGLPLVATDVGGNAEAVLDGYNGLLIPPNNVDAIANSLLALYHAPERRKMMGHCSRARIEEKFSLDQMLYQHEALYHALMAERSSAAAP